MDKEITYTIERKLTVGEIKDVITTAVEGGIYYWACLLNDDPDYIKAFKELQKTMKDGPCYCDIIFKVLVDGKAVKFQDAEDTDDGEIWSLTLDKLLTGIKMYEEKCGKSVHKAMDDGDFDANDADAIFQYALFNEIIYG